METYKVSYWTTDGKIVGMIFMAYSMADAESQARSMPNFANIANTPEKIN